MPLSCSGSPKENVSNSVWGRQKHSHREDACWSGSEQVCHGEKRKAHTSGRGAALTKAQIESY